MGFALPSGVVNTESAFYYAGPSLKFGPLVKDPSDQVLVLLDYSQLIPVLAISSYDFIVDVSSNPQLVLSFPQLNTMGNVLSFLLSGGIVGQQYHIQVRVYTGGVTRADTLTINIPSSGDCDCEQINPVPQIYTQIPLNSEGYVNTALRYFFGRTPPNNPNLMDSWYDPTVGSLYSWATDGVVFFWELMSQENVVLEAPSSNLMYSRYNKAWIANIIQTEAPEDGKPYARFMGGWEVIPTIIADAPADGGYYARRNNGWEEDPGSALPSTVLPLMDGAAAIGVNLNYALADHKHPSDTSKYDANNPLNFTTATQVIAALAAYAQVVDVPVPSNGLPPMDGVASAGSSPTYSRGDHIHPSDTSRLALTGGTMLGKLTLQSNPAGNLDAATKQYVDTGVSSRLALAGGTMTGDITLPGIPTGALGAVPKSYVDTAASNANIDCGTY